MQIFIVALIINYMKKINNKRYNKNLRLIENFIKNNKNYVKPREIIETFRESMPLQEINFIIKDLLNRNRMVLDKSGCFIYIYNPRLAKILKRMKPLQINTPKLTFK